MQITSFLFGVAVGLAVAYGLALMTLKKVQEAERPTVMVPYPFVKEHPPSGKVQFIDPVSPEEKFKKSKTVEDFIRK